MNDKKMKEAEELRDRNGQLTFGFLGLRCTSV